ncbi:MAG: Rpn family recombination-promoting nuclease/putative transposase, partial [Fibrobacter sp.]|nr:Rpn family recombination-promoting nuclease/putative transposase [Fibrobacter sp.]
MDTKKLTHPHDKFFKDAFSRVQTVQSFIGHYLLPEESTLIDLSTLEAVKDSHINPDLQELFSDAVYAASAHGKPEHVYLLFEHKSYPDPTVGVQLQKNIAMVLQYHQRQHADEGIPVIFTMVICHGKKSLIPYKGPVCRFVPYQNWQPLFPDLRYTFIDLQILDDDQIKGDPYLRILFLTLKYIHNPDLLEKIRDILVIFRELDKDTGAYEYLLSLITYLAGAAPKKLLKKLLGRINRILKKEKNPMSNIIE